MFEVKGDYVLNLIRLDISYQIIGWFCLLTFMHIMFE